MCSTLWALRCAVCSLPCPPFPAKQTHPLIANLRRILLDVWTWPPQGAVDDTLHPGPHPCPQPTPSPPSTPNPPPAQRLMDDIGELKPTFFCGVPRVFDRIYTGTMQKVGFRV